MDSLFIVCLGLLGLLAVFDLYVGVSNDAVNFLNSAVGSKTAPFNIVLAVASAGVLLGATFSSGMMDIAKSGVLVPAMFTYHDVLVIFCAVMVTDVLLLNLFNSLGLPTSTTVSIVFELLGGTVALAAIKIWSEGLPMADLGSYVNSAKALSMIMAILVSVLVAFVSGLVVQFVMRLVFSFNYQRIYQWIGGLFGGLCMTAIVYFLVMKGAKGASFMTPELLAWMEANTELILFTVFFSTTFIMQACISLRRMNVFPFIILSGTFALAFAFAGNDLVNFVGVPLAALDAWNIFSVVPGADADTFMMGGLAESTKTNSLWLLASGAVMVVTLWTSKKARRVIDTSVNLSASSRGGKEQFGSSLPARMLVRSSISTTSAVAQFLPASVLRAIGRRYEPRITKPGDPQVAFDEVRACMNLVLAAALIASATSLKLPLSTTYVTFMVAMGSSLADGAWDRESAVYRVSGVLTVVSGWFMTAFTAAGGCALVVFLFAKTGLAVMILAMLVAAAILVKTNLFSKDEAADFEEDLFVSEGNAAAINDLLQIAVPKNFSAMLRLSSESIDALLGKDAKELKSLKNEAVRLFDRISAERGAYYMFPNDKNAPKIDRDARTFYYRACTNMKEVSHALRDQIGLSEHYVANLHSAYTGEMHQALKAISLQLHKMQEKMTPDTMHELSDLLDRAQEAYIHQNALQPISLRKSELYLGKLMFIREMANRFTLVQMLLQDLAHPAEDPQKDPGTVTPATAH